MQTIEQNKMGYRPVLSLLMSMAFPPMLSMLIQSLHNIVGSMFVAQTGEDTLTAVSLTFPIQTLIVACFVGVGVGVNSYIARKLGEQNQKEAGNAMTHGLLLSLIGYLLFVAISSFTIRPFFEMFIDSAAILDDACVYTYVYVFLCFSCFLHVLIEKVFQSMEKMIFPMAIQATGAIASIILDSIMTFGLLGSLAMGVKGATIATIIGQVPAMSLSLFVFLTRKFNVKLDLKQFHFFWDTIRRIPSVRIPNICMNMLGNVLVIGLNSILIRFSNTAVSVYGIYYKLQAFVFMPASGLTQGAMPIMGCNYRTSNHERLLQTLRYAIVVTLTIMVCDCAIFLLFPTQLLVLFHAGEDMLRVGVPTLHIISIGFLPATLRFILPTLFQAMGFGSQSLIVFLLRRLCITLLLSWLFVGWFGLDGMWYSFLIAENVAAGVAVLLLIRIRKENKVLSSTFVQRPSAS